MRSNRISSNETGQTMVIIAIALVGLLGFVGLALDGGKAYQQRTQMQAAADSAAIAGARAVALGNNEATIYNYLNSYTVALNGATSFAATYYTSVPTGIAITGAGTKPANATGVCVTSTVNAPTSFLGVLGINTMTLGGYSCAASTTAGCGGGYATWANRTNSPFSTPQWLVTGSNNVIQGKSHTNWKADIAGSGHNLGVIENVGGVVGGAGMYTGVTGSVNTTYPVPHQTYFNNGDYLPGGRAALEAVAMGGSYTYHSGNWSPSGVISGLHYVNGDVNITNLASSTYTIVATGDIDRTGSKSSLHNAFIDGLLLYSNHTTTLQTHLCIDFAGSGARFRGIIFAPNGGVGFTGSDNTTNNGSLIGQRVDFSGSATVIAYDSTLTCGASGGGAKLVK